MSVAEKDPIKYHGVKANIKSKVKLTKKSNNLDIPSFQDVFGHLACEIANHRKDVVCITAAMREGTGLVPYEKSFPDRYYDVGIAEYSWISFGMQS